MTNPIDKKSPHRSGPAPQANQRRQHYPAQQPYVPNHVRLRIPVVEGEQIFSQVPSHVRRHVPTPVRQIDPNDLYESEESLVPREPLPRRNLQVKVSHNQATSKENFDQAFMNNEPIQDDEEKFIKARDIDVPPQSREKDNFTVDPFEYDDFKHEDGSDPYAFPPESYQSEPAVTIPVVEKTSSEYFLMIRNKFVSSGTKEEILNTVNDIVYGDDQKWDQYRDDAIQQSDFVVLKRMNLSFGVHIE